MRRIHVIVLPILFILSACNLSGESLPTPDAEGLIFITATPDLPTPDTEGVIYITATPDPALLVQAEPPTAVMPPTATVPPLPTGIPLSDQLATADQYLRNGYYEEAVQTFQALLAQGDAVPATLRADAAFRLGQSGVREGLFAEVVDALTIFITEFPQDARLPQAYFLRGDAYLGLSRWAEAVTDFQQYATLRPGLIDSYVYERIADAQFAQGLASDALANYDLAIAANRTLVPQLVLREKVAQILINAGRVAEAVAQYDAILEVARNAPYRASIDYAAALALMNAGQAETGLPRMQRVFDSYPTTAPAYRAMQVLLENDIAIDGWRRGRTSYFFGDYAGAIEAFNDYSSNFVLDAIPAELYLLLGRAYREIGNPDAAQVAFQTLINQYPGDPMFGEALLEQGRTRFLNGDIPGAIERYLAIAANFGYLERTAAEALWRVGYLYGTNDDPVRAREIFLRMADEFPNDEWTRNGLFLAASAAVNSQDWAIAENLYGRIAALAAGEDRAAAYLWVGRLARNRGDVRASDESFALAIQAAPDSFFAARANDLRNGQEAFTAPPALRFDFDTAAEQAQAEAWLRSTFAIEQSGDLSLLSATQASDSRLIRGSELWTVAAYSEALAEFTAVLDEARSTRDALRAYQLALYLRDLGAYQSSIVAAADVIIASGVATLDAPPFIARLRYPAYYADLVQEQAARYGFDSLLMLALMRQESLFNTNAVSSANARGLTQVIPSTGQYIAERLSFADYSDSKLFRPYVGIAFGAFYLDEQLRLFNGNAAVALAAYNAGPGRAIDWNRLSGGDVDALITTITFSETRSYVERIYSHYNIYRELYRAG